MNIRRYERFVMVGVCAVFATTLLLASRPAYSQKAALPRSVNFATHRVGTVFNAVGTGLAKVATDRGPVRVIVQPFSGPPGWVPSMNREGKPEIGIINVIDIWQATTGKITPKPLPPGAPAMKPRYTPNKNIRLLLLGTNLVVGIVVRADSPIKTLADLKGKRLTWGFPAFPPNIMAGLATVATAGMTILDVVPVAVPEVVSGIRALMEGRVDAAIAAVGMGIVSEANARVGVRFLPAGQNPKHISTAQGIMPGGNVNIQRAGPAGVKKDTPLWSYGISVVVSTHMSDELAQSLIKTWAFNWKELGPIHPKLRAWSPNKFVQKTATIPYHSGAIKFYKEMGMWTSEMDRNQQVLMRGELPFLK